MIMRKDNIWWQTVNLLLLLIGVQSEPQFLTEQPLDRTSFHYSVPHQDFYRSERPSVTNVFLGSERNFSPSYKEPLVDITPRPFSLNPASFSEGPTAEELERRGVQNKYRRLKGRRKPYSVRNSGIEVPVENEEQRQLFGQTPNWPSSIFPFANGDQKRQCVAVNGGCHQTKYRTFDGTCNNLAHPQWGAAGTPYGRLLPPIYSDGVHAPARSVTGDKLPDSRLLSRIFFPSSKKENKIWTLLFMQWGQIMTHDMSLGMDTQPDPNNPACCNRMGPLFLKQSKGEPCFPIALSKDDPIRKRYDQKCFDFLRSTTDVVQGCRSGKAAKPLSAVTHWMDASIVYGSDDRTAQELRLHHGGRLVSEFRNEQEWPPMDFNQSAGCVRPAPQQICYKAGDNRVNQNTHLTLLQIVLLREHNRVADGLSKINDHWDDEKLYQEARRIVIAEMQHISYYEWLTDLLGEQLTEESGITYKLAHDSYVNDYDDSVNPSVLNEHAQGAFRYLHTNIQGKLLLMSEKRYSRGHILLSEHMNEPTILESGAFNDLTRGMATQLQHDFDNYHTSEITENLFRRNENPTFGFDLKALDVHRGRDHGLPSYNTYREFCGLPRAVKFSDLEDVMDEDDAKRLSHVYKQIDDVDLAVGAALEKPNDPPLTGPTVACILKEQFRRTRVSDRFFYERGNHEAAFTPEQLTEIRKSTIARLLCDNAHHIKTMQKKAFRDINKENPLYPCDDFGAIPAIDLRAWIEINGRFASHFRPDYQKF